MESLHSDYVFAKTLRGYIYPNQNDLGYLQLANEQKVGSLGGASLPNPFAMSISQSLRYEYGKGLFTYKGV